MRIALVIPSLGPVGGVETLFISLAKQFIENGDDVDFVLGWEEGERPKSMPQGARVVVFGVNKLREMVLPLRAYLRATCPDAVLVAMWPLTSLAVIAHRLANSSAKLVLSDHNTLSLQYQAKGRLAKLVLSYSIRLTYPLANSRVVVSRGVALDICAISGLPHTEFNVIHNSLSIDISEATQAEIDTAWCEYKGMRVLTVGRLKRQKNHALLVNAFAKVLKVRPARLVILGTGEREDDTRQLIANLGLENDILMPGFVDRPAPYYQGADLFVLSSDYEGFGNVLVEALAQGIAVVSTDCPSGPAEILEDGRFGTLVPVGNVDTLADAIVAALASEHDNAALRRRSQAFSPVKVCEAYMHVLKSE